MAGLTKGGLKRLTEMFAKEIEAEKAARQASWDDIDNTFANTSLGETRGNTPARLGKYDTAKFGGVGPELDMSPEARMARARDMGLTTPAYRGSSGGKGATEPMRDDAPEWWTDSPDVASRFAKEGGAPVVIPGMVGGKNTLTIEAMGRKWDNIPVSFLPDGPLRQSFLDSGAIGSTKIDADVLASEAKKLGHDLLEVRNVADEGGRSTHFAALQPSARRGRFADFDPKKADSRDLLAQALLGATAAGGAYGALNAGSEADAKPWTPKLSALSKVGDLPFKGESIPSPKFAGVGGKEAQTRAMAGAGVLASSPFLAFAGSELMNDPTTQGNFAMDAAEAEWEVYQRERLKDLYGQLNTPPPQENIPLPDSYFNTGGQGRPESYGASPLTGKDLFDPSDAPQGGPFMKTLKGALEPASAELRGGTPEAFARAADQEFKYNAYHATNRDFPAFDMGKAGDTSGSAFARLGIFSSPDPEMTDWFANLPLSHPIIRAKMRGYEKNSFPEGDLELRSAMNSLHGANDAVDAAKQKWWGRDKALGEAYQQRLEAADVFDKKITDLPGVTDTSTLAPATMPLKLRMKNPGFHDHGGKHIGLSWYELMDDIQQAKHDGRDGFIIQNVHDGGKTGDVYITFDGKDVRSRFAAFNPEKKDANDLLAAVPIAGAAGLGAATLAPQDARAWDHLNQSDVDADRRLFRQQQIIENGPQMYAAPTRSETLGGVIDPLMAALSESLRPGTADAREIGANFAQAGRGARNWWDERVGKKDAGGVLLDIPETLGGPVSGTILGVGTGIYDQHKADAPFFDSLARSLAAAGAQDELAPQPYDNEAVRDRKKMLANALLGKK